jgi:hypothetical protein
MVRAVHTQVRKALDARSGEVPADAKVRQERLGDSSAAEAVLNHRSWLDSCSTNRGGLAGLA